MSEQPGRCNRYIGSSRESAASIIAKVGAACNISQKVLLVLIQKEQSLVTHTWPTQKRFNQATGFACYDNGRPCVKSFNGFFYQVWSAARQFQEYGNSPYTWFPIGRTTPILYQANMEDQCGRKDVFIENRATAALYYYTPYTPNDAALFSSGDACSAYGNKNFFQIYTDWFGSTQSGTFHPISLRYNELGGSSSWLGAPTSSRNCQGMPANGCKQNFVNGVLIYSPIGVKALTSVAAEKWESFNGANGVLGFPTTDPLWQSSTKYIQVFQAGLITVENGIATVTDGWSNGLIRNLWLQHPAGTQVCGLKDSGCYQQFLNGYIYSSSSSGAHSVTKEVYRLWQSLGLQDDFLGYPITDPLWQNTQTYVQFFQGGSLSVTLGIAKVISINDTWISAKYFNSWLGAPTGDRTCGLRASGCFQPFANGPLYFTPSLGGFPMTWGVRNLWASYGLQDGFLGYPTSGPLWQSSSTYVQRFEGGVITVTNGVPRL